MRSFIDRHSMHIAMVVDHRWWPQSPSQPCFGFLSAAYVYVCIQNIYISPSTTGIRLFIECSALYRVFFVGHLSAALGKVLLSVTTTFTESRTLSRGKHSAKTSLSSAKHSANGNTRQRAVNRRLKLTAVIFAESQVLALGKGSSLPSAPVGHSAKYIFIFFILRAKLFVVCFYTM
jgi:hypothetical protein